MITEAVSTESAAEWWGARRGRYNLALLAAGAIAFVCYVTAVWTRCASVVGADVTTFTTIFQGIGYLLAIGLANLFYYLGPCMERFVAPAHRASYRRWAFRAGLLFPVVLLGRTSVASFEIWSYVRARRVCASTSFDESGVPSTFQGRLRGRQWTIRGDTQRFRGTFSEDGRTLSGTWDQKSGRTWKPWLPIVLRKAGA